MSARLEMVGAMKRVKTLKEASYAAAILSTL